MNIVHLVLGKANPERMNGINKVVDNLARQQTSFGYQVEVWGITPTPDEETTLRDYSLKLFPALKNKMSITRKIEMALQQIKSDTIFHIHGAFIPEFYHFTRLLRKYKFDFIFTPHGNYAANALKKNQLIKTLYFNLFERRIIKQCKALQCLGKGEWQDIERLIDTPNKVLIPNGQDLGAIPDKRIELKLKEPVFGFCGRMAREQKGLDLLLEGFYSYVNNYNGKGRLWLIGEGEYLEQMKNIVHQCGLMEKVTFWGAQYGNRKFDLIRSMDAFYHPSRNEGLPTSVLEAAGAGIPCVVSEFTNMTEYISTNHAGIALKKNTPEEIALSMKQVEEWKESGQIDIISNNARKMIEKQFNWATISRQLIEVYAS